MPDSRKIHLTGVKWNLTGKLRFGFTMGDTDDTCPVCFERYDTETRIPRLLPCTHTACEKCLTSMLRVDYLVCHDCRKKYSVQGGVQAFVQNRYILNHLKAKSEEFDECKKHLRNLSLQCQDCKKDICQLCLFHNHRDHTVVDLVEEEKKKLNKRIDDLSKSANSELANLKVSRNNLEKMYGRDIKALKDLKEEIDGALNTLIFEAGNQKCSFQREANERMRILSDSIEQLGKIRRVEKLRTVKQMKELDKATTDIQDGMQVKKDDVCFTYYEYNMQGLDVSKLGKFRGPLKKEKLHEGAIFGDENEGQSTGLPGFFLDEAIINLKVSFDGNVGILYANQRIVKFDLTWKKLAVLSKRKDFRLRDFEEVTMAGKSCVVLGLRDAGLTFLDTKSLETVVFAHSDANCKGLMSTSSSTTLFYIQGTSIEDNLPSEALFRLVKLDCTTMPPVSETVLKIKHSVREIKCANIKGSQVLLISTLFPDQIIIYDMQKFELQDEIDVGYPVVSFTVDKHGSLYAVDQERKSVILCTLDDGHVYDAFDDKKKKQLGINNVTKIAWNSKTSHLIVVQSPPRGKTRVFELQFG